MASKSETSWSKAALTALALRLGRRLTPQRKAVLTKLLSSKRPLTAYELRDLLHPKDTSITPASVYRSLQFLIENGAVHRLETPKAFIACSHPDHPHAGQFLICRLCGTTTEAQDNTITMATNELGRRLGFTLEQNTVELLGTCSACSVR